MERKKTKKEIVQMLLNNDLNIDDEEQLMEILFNENLAIDVDKQEEEEETLGDHLADKITSIAGSWTFIIIFVSFLIFWVILNLKFVADLDPYPFILLNLVLSCVAALQAPVIMMSQNRAAKKDSARSKNDYKVDLKSELILEQLHEEMTKIINKQNKLLKILDKETEIKPIEK